jgi:nicotinamide phosphoribosyltransferase
MNIRNKLLDTDSYKASHYLQLPPGTEYMSSYIESRGGRWDQTVFFGLQMFLKSYMAVPISQGDIDFAETFWEAHVPGLKFNREGWQIIVDEYDGFLPLEIEAVPEGTVMGTKNVMLQMVNTDPRLPWLTAFVLVPMMV